MSMSGAFEARISAAVGAAAGARQRRARERQRRTANGSGYPNAANIAACEKRSWWRGAAPVVRRSRRRRRSRGAPPRIATSWRARDRSAAAGAEAVLLSTIATKLVLRVDRSGSVARRRVGRRSESLRRLRRRRSWARIRSRRCRASTARRSRSSAWRRSGATGCCRGARQEEFGNLRRAFEGFTRDRPTAPATPSCSRRSRRTTSRTRTSRCTPPTTTTGS